MSEATLYGLAAAALIGIGLYGTLAQAVPLRRLLAFNLLGSGVFLMFALAAFYGFTHVHIVPIK